MDHRARQREHSSPQGATVSKKREPTHGPGRQKIFQAIHDAAHPYVVVSQKLAQDERMSFEARGVGLYLLSKPNDWQIQVRDLMREGKCGKERVLRILQELERFGYVIWSANSRRVQLPNGKIFWLDAIFYESGDAPYTENPIMGECGPAPSHPEPVLPSPEKPTLTKNRWYKQTMSHT